MGIPQIAIIILYSLSVILNVYQHGTAHDTKKVGSTILSTAVIIALLIWGGFFK